MTPAKEIWNSCSLVAVPIGGRKSVGRGPQIRDEVVRARRRRDVVDVDGVKNQHRWPRARFEHVEDLAIQARNGRRRGARGHPDAELDGRRRTRSSCRGSLRRRS